MPLMETIRAYLGWCPLQASMRADLAVRPVTAAAAGGRDCVPRTEPGWWHRYHNQLLVAAIAFSAATAALFILVEDAPGYLTMWTGLAIGAGAALGFLLSYQKQYARVAAGEFTRANMTRRQRIIRYLSLPVAAVLLVACMVYLVQDGTFDRILGLVLGLSLIFWTWYGVTIVWERQHQATLIAEIGSTYVLGTVAQEETICR
ncbi:hypothetical protein DIC75_11130 [Methanoculleus sp. CWC-02]|uniref:DUF1673 domain-containing protein n=2 Tax=Methanoculleus oceani TaxID=2184756 RepID=A0ABD4THG5_9EURY|nr:hypothetical protein [Methanoculleus sp. CWC-02]